MKCFSKNNPSSLRGNVLFLILIAVALFAALSYAVTSSSKGGGSGIDKDKMKIEAAKVVQYSASMEQAITRMMLINQCADTQISFENPIVGGYVNGSAPADKRCHVFDPAGGGLAWQEGDSFTNRSDLFSGNFWGADWWIWGGQSIQDLGTSASDLILMLRVDADFCRILNERQSVSGIPMDADISAGTFTGAYTGPSRVILDEAQGADLRGHHFGCFDEVSIPDAYFYYHVLIAR